MLLLYLPTLKMKTVLNKPAHRTWLSRNHLYSFIIRNGFEKRNSSGNLMEDKKNIVIKVKYPIAGKKAEQKESVSKVITEWNIKRILLALISVVLILVALFYFIKRDTHTTDLQPQATLPEKSVNSTVKPKIASNKNITISENIVRALLTFKINDNEPEGEITLPLKLSKNKSTSIYYFVELTAMKGHMVYHEWLLDGELITRKKVNISDDTWRTSSRQLFIYSIRTNWIARLVDETGQILNEIHFNVIYE
jgi:hypothetical protein